MKNYVDTRISHFQRLINDHKNNPVFFFSTINLLKTKLLTPFEGTLQATSEVKSETSDWDCCCFVFTVFIVYCCICCCCVPLRCCPAAVKVSPPRHIVHEWVYKRIIVIFLRMCLSSFWILFMYFYFVNPVNWELCCKLGNWVLRVYFSLLWLYRAFIWYID